MKEASGMYLKKTASISIGLASYLKVIVILVISTDKPTLEKTLTTMAPHSVRLLRNAKNCWMSNNCLIQYQALLLDKDRLISDKFITINPATCFQRMTPKEPIHDCLEMLDVIHGT